MSTSSAHDQQTRKRKRLPIQDKNAKRHKPRMDIRDLILTPGKSSYYENTCTELSHYVIHLVHVLHACDVQRICARVKLLLRAIEVGPRGFDTLYERPDGTLVNGFYARDEDRLIGPCKLWIHSKSSRTNTGRGGGTGAQWRTAANAYSVHDAGKFSRRYHAQRMHGDEVSIDAHAEFLCVSEKPGRGQGTRAAPMLRTGGTYTSAITHKSQNFAPSMVCWQTSVDHPLTCSEDVAPSIKLVQRHAEELPSIIDLARIAYSTTNYWSGDTMTKGGVDALFFDLQQILWACKSIMDGNGSIYLVGQNKTTWGQVDQSIVKENATIMFRELLTPVRKTLQRVNEYL